MLKFLNCVCPFVVLISTTVCTAQGIPLLADPITTSDVGDYAHLLDLAPEQQLAVLPLHDQYREAFASLREGLIMSFQDSALNMGTSFMRNQFRIPERPEFETLIEQFGESQERIARVDRSFFDSLMTILTTEQAERLPRVRRVRELDSYWIVSREFAEDFNETATIDLSDLIRDIELSPAEEESLEPLLSSYEQSLLNHWRQLDGMFISASKPLLDAIDEFGFRVMTVDELMMLAADQTRLAEIFEVIDAVSAPIQAKIHQISEFNLRSMQQIAPHVPEERFRAVQREFYRNTYDARYPGMWQDAYDEALSSSLVPDDVRASIRDLLDGFRGEEKTLIDRIVRLTQQIRESRPARILFEIEDDAREEELRSHVNSFRALHERAEAAIEELLDAELIERLESDHRTRMKTRAAGSSRGQAGSIFRRGNDSRSENSNSGLAPMSAEDVETLMRWLKIADSESSVVTTMYDEYREQFTSIEKAETHHLTPELSDTVADLLARTEGMLQLLRAEDEQFLDNLSVLARAEHTDSVQAIALGRHDLEMRMGVIDRLNVGQDSGEHAVDLAGLLMNFSVSEDGVDELLDQILQYEEAAHALLETMLSAALSANRARIVRDRMRERDDDRDGPLNRAANDKYRDARQALHDVESRLAELNRATLEAAIAGLPGAAAAEIRVSFARTAWPGEFRSVGVVERAVERMRGVDGLQDWQRDRVHEIAAAFHEQAADLIDRAIETRRARRPRDRSSPAQMRREIEREIDHDRLEFEQEELVDRTLMEFHLMLSPQQADLLRADN